MEKGICKQPLESMEFGLVTGVKRMLTDPTSYKEVKGNWIEWRMVLEVGE